MQLIRQNTEKGRSVYFNEDCYIKVWSNVTPKWISDHVKLLKNIVPDYVLDYGGNWISFKVVPGVPASDFPHTPEFFEKIKSFCLENIKQTSPYVHGDWSLSNILIDHDNIKMCDWDNLGIYPEEEINKKLEFDLRNAFGDLYK